MANKSNTPDKTILSTDSNGQLMEFGLEHVKSAYIVEGLSPAELSARFMIPVKSIEMMIQESKLDQLRAAHIKHGLAQLQSIQLVQAEKLMNIESQFKRIRIVQLEKTLADYMAYYSKYGHFYRVHPITFEVMKDTNGIPVQIKIPNVSKEIAELKETFTLSEGLKQLLGQIDDIINKPKDVEKIDSDVIDVTNFNNLFQKKSDDE